VPGLRKGNASKCNIKRASPMGAPPPQPLRGARVMGAAGRGPPLVRHCLSANYSACKKRRDVVIL